MISCSDKINFIKVKWFLLIFFQNNLRKLICHNYPKCGDKSIHNQCRSMQNSAQAIKVNSYSGHSCAREATLGKMFHIPCETNSFFQSSPMYRKSNKKSQNLSPLLKWWQTPTRIPRQTFPLYVNLSKGHHSKERTLVFFFIM